MSRPGPAGAALRSAALTRVSLRGFWSSSLIGGQKRVGFCPLDKLYISVPGLSYTFDCPVPYPSLPSENHFSAGGYGIDGARRRAGCFRGRTGLRLPSGHDHYLARARWETRSKLPRALFLSSPASVCPVGRTAHQAARLHTGAVALAGHRSPHQAASGASARLPHTIHGPSAHPLAPTVLDSWLPPALYERRLKSLLLRAHGPLWPVARGRSSGATRAPAAGGSRANLPPGEKILSAAQAGTCLARDASRDTG